MARRGRSLPNEFSAPRLAGYAAARILGGLLIGTAGHYLGKLKLDISPPEEKVATVKIRPRHGPTEAQILDAQQPADAVMEYPAPATNSDS